MDHSETGKEKLKRNEKEKEIKLELKRTQEIKKT